jgi:hypothetical protein
MNYKEHAEAMAPGRRAVEAVDAGRATQQQALEVLTRHEAAGDVAPGNVAFFREQMGLTMSGLIEAWGGSGGRS